MKKGHVWTLIVAVLSSWQTSAQTGSPVLCLSFEDIAGPTVGRQEGPVRYQGYFTNKTGVEGASLNFDGFTTNIIIPPNSIDVRKGFTVEAWIAPQEYPWAWTGIADKAADTTSGISFGINYLGQVGFQAYANDHWIEIVSAESIPLLRWTHVAGSYHPQLGFEVFVNGKSIARKTGAAHLRVSDSLPVVIGRSQRKQYPALTERETSKKFLSDMYFDGLLDEVKLYNEPFSVKQIAATYAAVKPSNLQPLQYRKLPQGPEKLPGFGAFYTQLAYCPEWDRLWPVGEAADLLVGFDELPVRMAFWRGTGYCPAWITANGKLVSDQGPESWNFKTLGCFEQMSDKQCRYSSVRIIENTPARVVVHWRTASPGIDYSFNNVNPVTGWSNWTDEYYYIYPDAVAVRYQEIHGPKVAGMEWQQSELINQPGTKPQDNVHLNAATVVNMRGESETWSWEKPYGSMATGSKPIKDGIIQVINLKSAQKHFVIGEEGARWKPFSFGAREGFSTIPCWNHWPVAQLPNDGRVAPTADRPSSSCFGTLYPVKNQSSDSNMMFGRNLYGSTLR